MRFTITRGRAFECQFIIKKNGSTVAIELADGDTGTFTLSSVGYNACKLLDSIPMTITDAVNGEFTLNLTEEQTADLPYDVMFSEDGYPPKATCFAVLDIQSAEQGVIIVDIPQVYIRYIGDEECPVTQN